MGPPVAVCGVAITVGPGLDGPHEQHYSSAYSGLGRPGDDLASSGETKLGKHVLDVVRHGALREHKLGCDLTVRSTEGDQCGDLALARRQRIGASHPRADPLDPSRHP